MLLSFNQLCRSGSLRTALCYCTYHSNITLHEPGDSLLCTQCTEVPFKPKGRACLLGWNRERWSNTLGTPHWDARAVPMCSIWLWKQYLSAHMSETAKKHGLNAALHECRGLASSGQHCPIAWCARKAQRWWFAKVHAGNRGWRTKLKQITVGKD